MTGSDINEKLRAAFLAFVMITSVFAGTIALSGSAAANSNPDNATIDIDNSSYSPQSVAEGSTNTLSFTVNASNIHTQDDNVSNLVVDLNSSTFDLGSSQVTNTDNKNSNVTFGATNVDSTENNVSIDLEDSSGVAEDTINVSFEITNVNAQQVSSGTDTDVSLHIDETNDGTFDDSQTFGTSLTISDDATAPSFAESTNDVAGGDTQINVSVTDENAVDENTISVNVTNTNTSETYSLVENGGVVMGEAVEPSNFTDGNNNKTEYVNVSASLPAGQYEIGASANDATAGNQNSSSNIGSFDVDLGVSLDPDTVVANQETTVDVTLSNAPSGDVNYALLDDGTNLRDTGSTSGDTFSVTDTFDTGNNFTVAVSPDIDAVDLTYSNNDGASNVSVEDRNLVENYNVDPANPQYNGSATVSGTLVNSSTGDPVTSTTVQLNDTDTSTLLDVDTTGGQDGTFELSTDRFPDATTYEVVDTSDDSTVETVDVGAADATVSLETEGNNQGGFDENYTVTAQSDTGAELSNFTTGGTPGNYLNVTGPFDGEVTGDNLQTGNLLNSDYNSSEGITNYIHVSNASDASTVEFNATPNASADAVTVTLENNASETAAGYEANGTITPSTLDLTGSDSVDVQTSTEDLLVTLTKESIEVAGSTGGESAQSFDVDVVGSNNQAPGSGNLDNATVTISGDDVGISEQEVVLNSTQNTDGTASFSGLYPEQAGEITIDVVAYKTDGTEVTDSASVSVTGDQFNSFSPTSATIDDTIEASLQVTDADGAPLNNRVVNLTHEDSSGFNVTDTDSSSDYQTGQNITIDGPNGEVKVDGTSVATFSSINNGEYSASNISFDATGSVSLEVVNAAGSDTRVNATDVLTVSGAEVYEVSSDTTPALAGATENHNLTVTENGEIVNGSDLGDFSVTKVHDGSENTVNPSVVDTNDDGTDDALQVSVSAANTSDTFELRVDDGNARTGSTTLDVVGPDITASVDDREGNALTEGLNSTVDYTVEDPRDGVSGTFANGEISVTAVNTTYVINGTPVNDGGSGTVSLDADGQATVTIGVEPFGDNAEAPFELVHDASDSAGSSTAAGDVSLPAESPSIYLFENGERADVPANVEPNTEVDYTFEVADANDRNLPLDGVGFETNGGNLGVDTSLDEGFVDVSGDIGSGTVDLNINDTGVSATTLDSIVALETADLNLSADSTTVTQNDSIEFTLERLDRDRQTTGQLTITSADGDVDETVTIDGTQPVTFDSATYPAGDYTVEATKGDSSQKTFNADSVNVTVEEPDATVDATISADPSNTSATSTHTVTATVNEGASSVGSSLNGVEVDYSGTGADVSNVDQSDIESVTIAGTNVSDDLSSASASNNGETLTVGFSGNYNLEAGDEVAITYANAQNPGSEGTYDVTVTVNPQSGADSGTAELTISDEEAVPPVTGDSPPTNLDDDAQLEDVNGNGGLDIGDVQALYDAQDSDAVQNNVESFDFNGNGGIDIGDIQALYNEYQSSQ